MKCMCAQTRPRFTLSSKRVLGGMEFEPMLTPWEKSPLPENFPRGGSNPRRCGQRAQALPTELFWPPKQTIKIGQTNKQKARKPTNLPADRWKQFLQPPCLELVEVQTVHRDVHHLLTHTRSTHLSVPG